MTDRMPVKGNCVDNGHRQLVTRFGVIRRV